MKLTHEIHGEVSVSWKYDTFKRVIRTDKKFAPLSDEERKLDPKDRQPREYTMVPYEVESDRCTCLIRRGNNIVAEASVTRLHTQDFDKDQARKYSLTRVLKALYPIVKQETRKNAINEDIVTVEGDSKEKKERQRELRRVYWDAYYARYPEKQQGKLTAMTGGQAIPV